MKSKLIVIGTIGYVNLGALIYALFGLKSYGASLIAVAIPPAVSVLGTVFYFIRWNKAFPEVSKQDGRAAMSPYIMGASITVLTLVLVYGLAAYAELHK